MDSYSWESSHQENQIEGLRSDIEAIEEFMFSLQLILSDKEWELYEAESNQEAIRCYSMKNAKVVSKTKQQKTIRD